MVRNMVDILTTLVEKVRPDRTALVVVDMCNDFLHPDGKTVARAKRDTAAAYVAAQAQARLIEASRAAAVPVIYVVHTTLPDHASDSGPWLDARSRATFSVADICLDGSWGQQVIDELRPEPHDLIVKKYRYSGFPGTNLDLILRSLRVETVVCAGVSTNVCVEATARDAFSLDYYVVIPPDACASWDMSLHEASLATARQRYATLADADEIIGIWSKAGASS